LIIQKKIILEMNSNDNYFETNANEYALNRFARNLNDLARAGKLDPQGLKEKV
jgi:hypothetical protein